MGVGCIGSGRSFESDLAGIKETRLIKYSMNAKNNAKFGVEIWEICACM